MINRKHHHNNASRAGISLVEVAVSILIVGLLLVTSLQALGHVTKGKNETADVVRAQHLCRQMLAEVLATAYEEPVDTPVFGREAAETALKRDKYDDVDDFNGRHVGPPSDELRFVLPGFSGAWSRQVTVDLVTAADPSVVAGSDEGVKRVKITIWKSGSILAEMVALRSNKY